MAIQNESGQYFWNGSRWERVAGVNAGQFVSPFAGLIPFSPFATFNIFHAPAVGVQATISQAAAAGLRHVATMISYSLAGDTTLAAITPANVVLRDGATGAGTIKYQKALTVAAAMPCAQFDVPICMIGTVNTALTLEFLALATNCFETVSVQGFSISA